MDTNSKKTVLPAMMNFKKNKSEDSLSGSKDKEITSLKEEIKNLQMTLEQENPEKLKVNERNTKDQVSSDVINNQDKEIKCLKVSLDQEKEGKKEALLKNKEQNERFLK